MLTPAGAAAQESRGSGSAGADDSSVTLPAPVESSDYLAYTDFDEMVDFLAELAERSSELTVETLVPLPGETLPNADAEPALLMAHLNRGEQGIGDEPASRVAVLIIASQHGDEQSGKEAALRIVRDLALGPLNPLLDELEVYAVPMPNPWGTATGQRENARGLDLNRDHVRLETPAVAALHALFAHRRPEVVLDLHELGLAAYDAEIGLATHPNADSALIKFGRYRIMPYVANELARSGFSFHEYVLAMPEPGSGIEGAERYFTYGPLQASYARNAFALRGAISMLLEATSSREIHDLGQRTEVHYTALRAALEVIADAADEIRVETEAARRRADEWAEPHASEPDDPPMVDAPFVLRATYERDPKQPALTWLVRQPEGINVGTTDRWRPAIRPRLSIDRPAGYLVPADQTELIATLERHGFRLSVLTRPRRLRIGRYPVDEPLASAGDERPMRGSADVANDGPSEDLAVPLDSEPADTIAAAGRRPEPADTMKETLVVSPGPEAFAPGPPAADIPASALTIAAPPPVRADDRVVWIEENVPAGTVYLDLRQPDSMLLMALLEPWSQDSWFGGEEQSAEPTGPWHSTVRVEAPLPDGTGGVPTRMGQAGPTERPDRADAKER